MEKKCTKCKVIYPIENFYWRKTRNNYSPKCKPCWTEDSKTYNTQNKEARTEYYNKWRENNDDWKKYQRDYKKKSSPQQLLQLDKLLHPASFRYEQHWADRGRD